VRAEDLRLEELVDFSDGFVRLKGRRLVLHDMHAFAQLRKDLVKMLGPEHARTILTRFGYFWGQADSAAMQRLFTWESPVELAKASARLYAFQGVTKALLKVEEIDIETKQCRAEFSWHNSGEAEEHITEFGLGRNAACWILTGYASGYMSYSLGFKVYFIEDKCVVKGDALCTAYGKDESSWGELLTPHIKYFQSDDISGKIQYYTNELKRKEKELAAERQKWRLRETKDDSGFIEIKSRAFQKAVESAILVSRYDTSVLISGESGSGKEVLARYIHSRSSRGKNVFMAINCGALPETLLEGELFGYRAGAFTGAVHDRVGLFEEADGGSLFLDEIGELSSSVQVKLLRVLQEKEIMRLGENKTRKINARIIAASNRNLAEDIKAGRFREDLYYRLAVVEIEVPPLRERREDILPLARHFVKNFSKKLKIPQLRLDPSCIESLLSYDWPGNVRELENALERAAVFSLNGLVTAACLPQNILRFRQENAERYSVNMSLGELESAHIRAVMDMVNGNKTKAASILGISPVSLWRKLKTGKGEGA